ncbi:unnamed protein product, partial [Callosobruchus maculatus]
RWEGKESPRPSTSTSPELEVDSPPHSRTNSPSAVTEFPKIESSSKNTEAFSVSALLRPDNPKKTDIPCYQETVSVTRSYLYPPFIDFMKDVHMKSAQEYTSQLIPRIHPGFLPSSFYPSQREGEERGFLPTTSLYFSA